jgi:hypothetical protein
VQVACFVYLEVVFCKHVILAFLLGQEITSIALHVELLLLYQVLRLGHHRDLADDTCRPQSEALGCHYVGLEPDDVGVGVRGWEGQELAF